MSFATQEQSDIIPSDAGGLHPQGGGHVSSSWWPPQFTLGYLSEMWKSLGAGLWGELDVGIGVKAPNTADCSKDDNPSESSFVGIGGFECSSCDTNR